MKIMVDSEYLEKLQKSLGVDEDGNAVVGKNLEVDGYLSVNDGQDGIFLNEATSSEVNIWVADGALVFTTRDGIEEFIFDAFNPALGDGVVRVKNLKTIFGNQSLVGEGNIDLYRHSLSISGATPATTLNLDFLSSSNLKCDSVQDLRTLLKISGNKIEFLYGNLYQGPYTQCQLVVSADICQFTVGGTSTAINVTTVQDTVTTI